MKIGVLGCGSIGQRHIRNLVALGSSVAAHDPSAEQLAAAVALGAQPVTDTGELFAGRPDAIFVCTPPAFHAEGLRAALGAGADVFVEKPIASDASGIDELIAEAERSKRIFAVGYNLRFHTGLRKAKALVDEGAIGRPLIVRAEFGQYLPDWRPTRDYREGYNASERLGGGVLLDQSHELDYVRWIFGEVRSVSAVVARVSDLAIDVEDTALLHVRLANGPLVEIHLDSVRRDYRRGCTVIGTEGTLEWDLRSGVRLTTATGGREDFATAPDINDMYVDEVRHFIECCTTRARPLVGGADGLRVLQITLAAKRAAAEGREITV